MSTPNDLPKYFADDQKTVLTMAQAYALKPGTTYYIQQGDAPKIRATR